MCACRILRRLTTSVICMRDLSSLALRLHREDADLAGLHVVQDFTRQIGQRPRRQFFQDPGVIGRPQTLQFVHQAGGDFARGLIGDDGDFLAGLDAQAHVHRIVCAGS